jgi:hypothetical protein
MNFCQRSLRQAAAESCIEPFGAGRQKAPLPPNKPVTAKQSLVCRIFFNLTKILGKPPFDLRNFPAQGKNGLLRQGGCRHDGLPSRGFLFLLCSY